MEKKRKSKKERTKEKIFNTAISLFIEKGYENTTVQEITEKVDVAKGTFFIHFPTKDAILTYLGEQRLAITKDKLVKDLADITGAGEKLLAIFELLARTSEEDKVMTRLISYEIIKKLSSPEFEKEAKNLLELQRIFESILYYGQQTSEFRNNFQPSEVADILVSIYFYTLLKWLSEGKPTSLVEEYRARVSIVLRGINYEGR